MPEFPSIKPTNEYPATEMSHIREGTDTSNKTPTSDVKGREGSNVNMNNVNEAINKAPLSFLNLDPTEMSTDPSEMDVRSLESKFMPTSGSEIRAAVKSGNHKDVVLWRGMAGSVADGVKKYGTAGGVPDRNENAAAPTAEEAKAQVGGSSSSKFKLENRKPEYTTKPGIAKSFGAGDGNKVVAVKVNTKYLTRGSRTEGGWVINKEAPVEFLGAAKGASFVNNGARPVRGD